MKKIALYILVVFAAVSCYKDAEYDQTLGMLMEYNILSESGGSTQVGVFSNTYWKVEMDRPAPWASINLLEGYKSGYLVFDFDVNYGRSRRVNLIFTAGNETRRMCMFQKARISDPTLELGGSSPINIPAAKDTLDIPLNTDLVYDLADMFLSLTYPDGAPAPETPWVSIASIAVNKLSVAIAANTTGQSRTVDMCLSHTDGGTVEKTDKGIYDSIEGDTLDSNIITIVQGN